MEPQRVQLEADAIDEAAHGAILREPRRVDVEKLEERVEQRENGALHGVLRPFDRKKTNKQTEREKREHEKQHKGKQRRLQHRKPDQLNRLRQREKSGRVGIRPVAREQPTKRVQQFDSLRRFALRDATQKHAQKTGIAQNSQQRR